MTSALIAHAVPSDNRSAGFRPCILAGAAIVFVFFGVLGTWAALVPLSSAAVAPGTVSSASSRKTIQHLEGGIVDQILVKEGDLVQAGQPLIRLDVTRPKATLALLRGRLTAARALEARLIAQRDGADRIRFPQSLLALADDPKVVQAIKGQAGIFDGRKEAVKNQLAIERQRVGQLEEEILGLEGQIKAEGTQLDLIGNELRDVQSLVEKGIARKPRLLALQREAASIEGSRSQNRARIARARQAIGEARLRIPQLRTTLVNEAAEQLRTVQTELFDLTDRIAASEDVLKRTEIIAPRTGYIVGLQVHTSGGVISPGETLLNIVPSGDKLIVEAQIDPNDIDVVHPGLEAQIRLTPYSARTTPSITGKVASISADRITDERTGHGYFLARIELTEDVSKALNGAVLSAGMPAEVMIVTGARTALEYLLAPLRVSFNRALKES